MEQFELRFIVCGNDLAATRECAKILFEAPLPGKVTPAPHRPTGRWH